MDIGYGSSVDRREEWMGGGKNIMFILGDEDEE